MRMKLFDVYPVFDITPVKAQGCYVWDDQGTRYLDLYGGHAVISVGHSHPVYVDYISNQLNEIGFYSNSVKIPQQQELSTRLGKLSGLDDYQLFLCNSGAEANENAMKLASFATGKKGIISFKKGFHGRTSGAVSITDNPKIIAPVNENEHAIILPLNDIEAVEKQLQKGDIAAVVIEGIQGIGGIHVPDPEFLEQLEKLCKQHGALLILDEIQSGYGRSGKFFAFQYTNIKPDMVTLAKGMGNGFPVGGVLISPELKPWPGMLGTTFGGNYLACAASIAVLDIMEQEQLVSNSEEIGNYLMDQLQKMPGIKEVRGKGLMIGIEFETEIKTIRQKLLFEEKIFTGVSGANTIRLLPPLTLSKEQAEYFIRKFEKVLSELNVHSV
ncbi:acetylornithine aminotransferase [Sunxiuqinia elliptica]|uniref:Acetylornithine aminotransferase n=2 Tax=Sunxiuqinia elliptica TaxID=655355 RepID=A0A4R6HB85_9BACT|nr:acetylornithine aminotransferase [Sunxiuqinia elliptica]TDO65186.1 acetylornithine aminotransferase [Sunxiuqinia elliptica]